MALTPLDIQNKHFSKTFRGYNADEVDDFLDVITHEYDSLLRKVEDLEKSLMNEKEKVNLLTGVLEK